MTKKPKMTKIDDEVLAKLPDDWFDPLDPDAIPHYIRCPEHRCERLEAFGRLERRYAGTYPGSIRQYRKKEGESQ